MKKDLAIKKTLAREEVEEMYSKIFRLSPVSLTLAGIDDGVLVEANKAFEEITGYAVAETLGKTAHDLNLYPDPRERDRLLKIMEKEGKVRHGEMHLRHKSGDSRIVLISAEPMTINNKKYVISAAEDITERKLLEEELLKSSSDRYKALFLSSRDAVMTLEPPSWRFTSGNPATIKMFATKSEGDFLTYEPWRLSPERQPDGSSSTKKAKAMIDKAMREGFNLFEWTHKRANGEEFMAEVQLSKVEQNGKTYLHALVRDITERKKMEEKLKEYEEEKFKVIFDGARDGMALADVETKRFFLGNTAFCSMLGYSLEEIKKLGVQDIHPKKDLPRVLDQFDKQMRGEVKVAENLPVIRKDGTIFYADISSSLVAFNGKKYLLGVFRDITERNEAEKKRKESLAELEKMNKLMIGRELKMVELKKEIEKLKKKLS
jgi:PAS domain S-box-containing protein